MPVAKEARSPPSPPCRSAFRRPAQGARSDSARPDRGGHRKHYQGLFDSGEREFPAAQRSSAIELGAVDLEERADPYVDLLAGSFRERVWAARLVGHQDGPADIGVLAVLAQDSDGFLSRAAAAAGAARLVARDEGGELARSVLRRNIANPRGCRCPLPSCASWPMRLRDRSWLTSAWRSFGSTRWPRFERRLTEESERALSSRGGSPIP